MTEKAKIVEKKFDTKEFELPETLFVRDIENRVFQGIVLYSLSQVEGISLIESTLIANLLGRRNTMDSNVKGIHAEQDSKNHSVSIKVEINICYGYMIPEKSEELQNKITEDITKITGLHVSSVHVIFKNVIAPEQVKRITSILEPVKDASSVGSTIEDLYSEEF